MKVPPSHPRYESLLKREKIIEGIRSGIVAEAGLIAHGRGEAFDYLIGERTLPEADLAEKTAAYTLLLAQHPVISVNGNTAVLVPGDIIRLSNITGAKIEINLFYRSKERVRKIAELLREHGANDILGEKPDAAIPGLNHKRALCTTKGTIRGEVVLVPLEDGDRTMALKKMGKTVIVIDLNPFSRTAKTGDITIVDDVVRAMPGIIRHVNLAREEGLDIENMKGQVAAFDNIENLNYVIRRIHEDM
jgi:4-phosphopantoate--beta-alanine ligase